MYFAGAPFELNGRAPFKLVTPLSWSGAMCQHLIFIVYFEVHDEMKKCGDEQY